MPLKKKISFFCLIQKNETKVKEMQIKLIQAGIKNDD
jgi:hypothetical protein